MSRSMKPGLGPHAIHCVCVELYPGPARQHKLNTAAMLEMGHLPRF